MAEVFYHIFTVYVINSRYNSNVLNYQPSNYLNLSEFEIKSLKVSIKSEAIQKGRHPALDAGSPAVDRGRRCRIVVRHDETDYVFTISRPFWTASDSFSKFLSRAPVNYKSN